jgi:hypothetical protein
MPHDKLEVGRMGEMNGMQPSQHLVSPNLALLHPAQERAQFLHSACTMKLHKHMGKEFLSEDSNFLECVAVK